MSSTCGPSRCTSARTGATTTAGARSPPSRSRHMIRRRRPMVSSAGDTRSNGRVSHAGKSSTASAPSIGTRSPARRSASATVGTARQRSTARPISRWIRGEERARRLGDRDDLAAPGRDRGDARVLGQQPRQLGERSRRHGRTMARANGGSLIFQASRDCPRSVLQARDRRSGNEVRTPERPGIQWEASRGWRRPRS